MQLVLDLSLTLKLLWASSCSLHLYHSFVNFSNFNYCHCL